MPRVGLNAAAAAIAVCFLLSGCGTISTFQTGKTTPQGKFAFGMGTSGGLFRTKSKIVGFPIELGYGSAEIYAGYGLFDFLEINVKGMAAMFTNKEDFKSLSGMPLFGGGQARVPVAQERWGFPFSLAVGAGYYAGAAQSRQRDLQSRETKRELTVTKDKVYSLHASKDVFKWVTLYGAYKFYSRTTLNRRYDYGIMTSEETVTDPMRGSGAGICFNVGRDKNTHIMFEANTLYDTDEPDSHYQKQAGLGMSVEF